MRYLPKGSRFESGWATVDLFPLGRHSSLVPRSPHQTSKLSYADSGVAHAGLRPLRRIDCCRLLPFEVRKENHRVAWYACEAYLGKERYVRLNG